MWGPSAGTFSLQARSLLRLTDKLSLFSWHRPPLVGSGHPDARNSVHLQDKGPCQVPSPSVARQMQPQMPPKVRLAVRTIEQRRSALNASARAAAVAAARPGLQAKPQPLPLPLCLLLALRAWPRRDLWPVPSGPPRLEVGRVTGQDITERIRSQQHPNSHTSQATKQPRNLHACCEELRRKAQSQSRRRPYIDSETEQLVKKLIGSLPAAASATNQPKANCQPAPTNKPSAGNQILSPNQK